MWKHPYVLLLLTVIIYSGNILVGKVVTTEMPPFTLAFLRFCIALLLMIPLGFRDINNYQELWKKEWKPLIGLALFGITFFNALVYFSLAHTSTINAGIIEATTPIFSIILGFLFLQERLSKGQLFGVTLSLFGVVWVITKGSIDLIMSLSFNIGDLTMCLAMVSWAIYSIYVKKHNWKFPLYGGVLMIMLIGSIILLPLALTEWNEFLQMEWNFQVVFGLIFVGIFPSVLALIFWNKAVQEIGPSRSSVFLNLIPVFTAIGAILFLNEEMTLLQAFGGLLVLVGVYMTTRGKKVKLEKRTETFESKTV